ncbi:anti-sigma-I factor RsgI family protein, partial [Clostridium saccharobutylicum]
MDDRLFELLDNLNIKDTKLLLDEDINLEIDSFTRKRIEKSVMKKAGYYNKQITFKDKISNILGGNLMKRKIALALGACIILGSGGGAYAYTKSPVAYVSMDINPSVELGVNAFDKVVSVEAYNEDGKKILEDTNLENYEVKNAISTLLEHAISAGYISEDGSSKIEITTSTDKQKVADKLDDSLKDVADETLDSNDVKANVETENVALARRDEARKLGITPGKLNLIQKLQELDPSATVEDYKDKSVKEIQKKTIELRKGNTADETTNDANQTTNDNEVNSDAATEENNTSSNDKDNNDKAKKEENSNVNKLNNDTDTENVASEKENNSSNNGKNNDINNGKSNNNSSNSSNNNSSENSQASIHRNIRSEEGGNNGNSSKSERGDNGN